MRNSDARVDNVLALWAAVNAALAVVIHLSEREVCQSSQKVAIASMGVDICNGRLQTHAIGPGVKCDGDVPDFLVELIGLRVLLQRPHYLAQFQLEILFLRFLRAVTPHHLRQGKQGDGVLGIMYLCPRRVRTYCDDGFVRQELEDGDPTLCVTRDNCLALQREETKADRELGILDPI